MDANTMLIDIMHDLRAINPNRPYRITRRNRAGVCDTLYMDIKKPFMLRDIRRNVTWRSDKGEYELYDYFGVTSQVGRSIAIDLRDVFLADEL